MPLGATSVVIIDGANLNRSTTTDADGAFQLPDLELGGFAVRFRHEGYDSVFRGIQLFADTSVSVPMRPAMQSLAGTWTGTMTETTANGSPPQTGAIPELNLTHTGADIAGIFPNTQTLFTATMRDPSPVAIPALMASAEARSSVTSRSALPRLPAAVTANPRRWPRAVTPM
jgi:hypothetical protein